MQVRFPLASLLKADDRLSRGMLCVHRSAPPAGCIAILERIRRAARLTGRFEPFSLQSYHILVSH